MKLNLRDDSVRSDKKFKNTRSDLYKKLAAQFDHIHRILVILKTEDLKSLNLTYAQLAILMRIWSCNDNITPAELGRDLLRKPNTISLILKRMIRDGLVQKRPDPDQKHSYLLSLTLYGQELLNRDKKSKAFKKLFSQFSEEQLLQFAECLQVLDGLAKKELGNLQEKSEYIGGTEDFV
jgi:DNA-binding MarR family transcriptional regulator